MHNLIRERPTFAAERNLLKISSTERRLKMLRHLKNAISSKFI